MIYFWGPNRIGKLNFTTVFTVYEVVYLEHKYKNVKTAQFFFFRRFHDFIAWTIQNVEAKELIINLYY